MRREDTSNQSEHTLSWMTQIQRGRERKAVWSVYLPSLLVSVPDPPCSAMAATLHQNRLQLLQPPTWAEEQQLSRNRQACGAMLGLLRHPTLATEHLLSLTSMHPAIVERSRPYCVSQ